MNLYAISNGKSYSSHVVYVFTSCVPHEVIEALVADINKGRAFEPFEILAGAEVLNEHVKVDPDAIVLFLDCLEWEAGYDEDDNPRDVLTRFPELKEVLTSYRARTRKEKSWGKY